MKEKCEENSRKIEIFEKREQKYEKMLRKMKKKEKKYKINFTMIKEELEALKENIIVHSSGDSSLAQRCVISYIVATSFLEKNRKRIYLSLICSVKKYIPFKRN
jgi:hypothetical protein